LINLTTSDAKEILEYLRGYEKSQLHHSPILCGHIKTLEAAIELPPNMFWDNDEGEDCVGSIEQLLDDKYNYSGLSVGDVVEIQQAYKAPNIKVRITECDENSAIDYEVVND
jgi:hypothetical protein